MDLLYSSPAAVPFDFEKLGQVEELCALADGSNSECLVIKFEDGSDSQGYVLSKSACDVLESLTANQRKDWNQSDIERCLDDLADVVANGTDKRLIPDRQARSQDLQELSLATRGRWVPPAERNPIYAPIKLELVDSAVVKEAKKLPTPPTPWGFGNQRVSSRPTGVSAWEEAAIDAWEKRQALATRCRPQRASLLRRGRGSRQNHGEDQGPAQTPARSPEVALPSSALQRLAPAPPVETVLQSLVAAQARA